MAAIITVIIISIATIVIIRSEMHPLEKNKELVIFKKNFYLRKYIWSFDQSRF